VKLKKKMEFLRKLKKFKVCKNVKELLMGKWEITFSEKNLKDVAKKATKIKEIEPKKW
jgi:hypothetical protein